MSKPNVKTDRVLDWLTFFGSVGLLLTICFACAAWFVLRWRYDLGVCQR